LEEIKECTKCKRALPLNCFSKDKKTKDGHNYLCRECKKKQLKKYRNSKNGRATRHDEIIKYKAKNRDNFRAYTALYRAIKKGIVSKMPCIVCGEPAFGHHENYSKPLDVIWFCPKHHSDLHKGLIDNQEVKRYGD